MRDSRGCRLACLYGVVMGKNGVAYAEVKEKKVKKEVSCCRRCPWVPDI